MFPECIGRLITDLILKNACKVKGYFFGQTRRAVIALEYLDDAYQVYKSACRGHKVSSEIIEFVLLSFFAFLNLSFKVDFGNTAINLKF